MNTKELLVSSRALISDPAHWTQGTFARDIRGDKIRPTADTAVQFCSLGAVHRTAVTYSVEDKGYLDVFDALQANLHYIHNMVNVLSVGCLPQQEVLAGQWQYLHFFDCHVKASSISSIPCVYRTEGCIWLLSGMWAISMAGEGAPLGF